ncbi:MAG: thioredoxin fold domain-containing protein [Gammaproteobacteria bacterium]|nr:thioredoxin fold domain-containing protein [Gammaproteobacteria bacterium]
MALTQMLAALVLFACALRPAQALPRAVNLHRLGAAALARHTPIVILFRSHTCRYCEVVAREFLDPAAQEPQYRHILFRSVYIDSHKALVNFTGARTTEAGFAARYHIRLVPDIRFFDGRGREVAHSLLGLSTPDFYSAYLSAALHKAMRACAQLPAGPPARHPSYTTKGEHS